MNGSNFLKEIPAIPGFLLPKVGLAESIIYSRLNGSVTRFQTKDAHIRSEQYCLVFLQPLLLYYCISVLGCLCVSLLACLSVCVLVSFFSVLLT